MEHTQRHRERALSFGPAAAAYALHRPDYPHSAVEWRLAAAAPDHARVLDLGAGTGKLTGVLIDHAESVVAIEPDELMRAELSRHVPTVSPLAGTAERIPLRDDAVDAVFAGQAAHWFDMDRALPEIARVLRPGGVFVVLANTDDDRVDWVREFHALAHGGTRPGNTDLPEWALSPLFVDPEMTEFQHQYRRTADSLIDMVATHSAFLIMPAGQRTGRLHELRAYLAGRPETAQGEFDLPLITMAVRMRVREHSGTP